LPKKWKKWPLKFEDDKIGKEKTLIRGHAKEATNNSFHLLSAGPPPCCKASYAISSSLRGEWLKLAQTASELTGLISVW
jgi:hypothetical protein